MYRIKLLGESETEWRARTELPAPMITIIAWERLMPLPSLANQREHWRKRHKRSAMQKDITRIECIVKGATKSLFPEHVTLIRRGPRKLDGDNLQGAFKSVRDAIADAFDVDDGDDGITWVYQQEVGPWLTSAKVRIVARPKSSSDLEKAAKRLAARVKRLAKKGASAAPTATSGTSGKRLRRTGVGR